MATSYREAKDAAQQRANLTNERCYVVQRPLGNFKVVLPSEAPLSRGAEVVFPQIPEHGRFSKRTLALYCIHRAAHLYQVYRFTRETGSFQVQQPGLSDAVKIAYGEWITLIRILENFDLGKLFTWEEWQELPTIDSGSGHSHAINDPKRTP